MSGPLSLRLCCLSAMAPALTEAATQARAKLSKSISLASQAPPVSKTPLEVEGDRQAIVSPEGREACALLCAAVTEATPQTQQQSALTGCLEQGIGSGSVKASSADHSSLAMSAPSSTGNSNGEVAVSKSMPQTVGNNAQSAGKVPNVTLTSATSTVTGGSSLDSSIKVTLPSETSEVDMLPNPVMDPIHDPPIEESSLDIQEVLSTDVVTEPQPGSSGMAEVGVLTSADLSAEVNRRQRDLERKADRLLRRLRRLQSRQIVSHTKQQLNGLVDHQHRNLQSMAKSMKSPPANVDMRAELLQSEDVKSLSTAALVSLVQRLQSSQQLSLRQRLTGASGSDNGASILKLDESLCVEMNKTSSTIQMQLRHLQSAVDSDATESSSGGESCDEDDYFDDKQHRVSIDRRAEWRWAMERAAIAARWTWLQAQVSDLEYRIRQQTDIFRQIRAAKGVVVLGEPPSPTDLMARNQAAVAAASGKQGKRLTPLEEKIAMIERKNTEMSPCNLSSLLSNVDKQSSKLKQQLGSVYTPTGSPNIRTNQSSPVTPNSNGLDLENVDDDTLRAAGAMVGAVPSTSNGTGAEQASPVTDNTFQAARCRPVRSYGKRKLLRTAGLFQVSRKAARLSSVKCHCNPPGNTTTMPCVMCGGRYNNVTPIDPQMMPLPERVALLDSSFHPVLSFTQDVPLTVHFEALLKSGDWQHKPPPKLLRPPPTERRRNNKTINDHVRRYNRKLTKSASAAMLSSAKIKNKYEQKPLSWGHNGAIPTTPSGREGKRPYVRQRKYRLKRSRDSVSSRVDSLNKRRRTMSSAGLFNDESGCLSRSASSATLREMKDREMKRRRGESAFDINNIVIPYSMAALTRVEKLQYKEIITPKWREIQHDLNSVAQQENKEPVIVPIIPEKVNHVPAKGSNGVRLMLPNKVEIEDDDETEDVSDEQYSARHHRCEMMERKRFLPANNPLRRGRSNRTDSQVSLSTMDSFDAENSMSGIQTPPTTPASANSKAGEEVQQQQQQPSVLPSCSGEEERIRTSSVSSREDMRVRTLSTSSNRSRSVSISDDKLSLSLTRPDMELIRTYEPWADRKFPLSEDDYNQLNCDMDQMVTEETMVTHVPRKSRSSHSTSHTVIAAETQDPTVSATTSNANDDPEVTFNTATATPEDSNPSSPLASSSSSEIIDDDPNDPEWTVIGDQKVQKAASCPSGLVLKLAKR